MTYIFASVLCEILRDLCGENKINEEKRIIIEYERIIDIAKFFMIVY